MSVNIYSLDKGQFKHSVHLSQVFRQGCLFQGIGPILLTFLNHQPGTLIFRFSGFGAVVVIKRCGTDAIIIKHGLPVLWYLIWFYLITKCFLNPVLIVQQPFIIYHWRTSKWKWKLQYTIKTYWHTKHGKHKYVVLTHSALWWKWNGL